MKEHKKKNMKFEKSELYREQWKNLSQEEKDEIVERSKKRKEEEQRKLNRKTADIMMGRQRTQDNCWE
jgi:predicted Fe-S protein YdhL (DUF1289 family)